MGKIDDFRTDKFDEEIENPEHWEKKLEVKIKSLELIETEIDNRVQNMHKMVSAFIIGVSSLGIYLLNNLDKNNLSSVPVNIGIINNGSPLFSMGNIISAIQKKQFIRGAC